MLSAVESFGPATGGPSAAHPYAHHHHNPYAIAAAAAAAGSAAAAAAAVIPQAPLTPTTPTHPHPHSLQQHQQQHFQQQHQQQQHHHLLQQQQQHQQHLGFFLPPPTTSLSLISPPATSPSSTTSNSNSSHTSNNNNILPTTALVLTSKCSPLQLAEYNHHQQQQLLQHHHQQQQQQHQQQQHQQQQHLQQQQQQQQHQLPSPSRSPRRCSSALKAPPSQHEESDGVMSSAEFARPHPKQPRYTNGSSSTNNNNSIPMQQRSPNGGGVHSKSSVVKNAPLNNNDKQLNLNHNSNNNNNNNNINNNGGIYKNGYHTQPLPSTSPRSQKYANEQCGAVNLVTNHNNNNQNHNLHARLSHTPPDAGRSSSSSSSVDVENDGSMSPIAAPHRKLTNETHAMLFSGGGAAEKQQQQQQPLPFDSATAAAVAAYQFNFPQLYSRAAIYGASASLFPSHHASASSSGALRPHPSFLGGTAPPPLHPTTAASHETSNAAAAAFSAAAYMQAMQNVAAAAGIYNHNNATAQSSTVQTAQPSPPAAQAHHQHQQQQQQQQLHAKNLLRTPNGSMLALAPPTTAATHSAPSNASKLPPNNASNINGGTYLNGKVNHDANAAGNNFFKVPSGKEGSLKHRILTRPTQPSVATDAPPRTANITAAVVRTNNATSNFTKGAYIELANGVLRRVEDMRTEDFIQCAERSAHHQLAESTVVKISVAPNNNVVITFSYDKNCSKADVEVSPEHPFFVYGQGWASYNPEQSHKAFGLKCQRLQVGDICISLTSRDTATTSASTASASTPQSQTQQRHPIIPSSQNRGVELFAHDKSVDSTPTLPQNLSRKLHQHHHQAALQDNGGGTNTNTPPPAPPLTSRLSNTLASVAAANGYAMPLSMPLHMLPPHLAAAHHPYADLAELAAAYAAESAQISRGGMPPTQQNHLSPSAISSFYQQQQQQHHQQQQQQHHALQQQHAFHAAAAAAAAARLTPAQTHSAPIAIQMTRSPTQHNTPHQPYYESPPSSTDGDPRRNHSGSSSGGVGCDDEQDQPVDASMSRKRRWSAPESICDDDDIECQPTRSHQPGSYKAFITTAAASNPTP